MRKAVLSASLIVALFGAVVLIWGLSTSIGAFGQAGAAMVASALALLGVAAGLKTWEDERRATRESHAAATCAALSQQVMGRFAGGYDPATEAKLRADICTWASPEMVRALGSWNAAYDSAAASGQITNGTLTLTSEGEDGVRSATLAVLGAARSELGAAPVDGQELLAALFNQPGATRDGTAATDGPAITEH